jgi:hypothetical protein
MATARPLLLEGGLKEPQSGAAQAIQALLGRTRRGGVGRTTACLLPVAQWSGVVGSRNIHHNLAALGAKQLRCNGLAAADCTCSSWYMQLDGD